MLSSTIWETKATSPPSVIISRAPPVQTWEKFAQYFGIKLRSKGRETNSKRIVLLRSLRLGDFLDAGIEGRITHCEVDPVPQDRKVSQLLIDGENAPTYRGDIAKVSPGNTGPLGSALRRTILSVN